MGFPANIRRPSSLNRILLGIGCRGLGFLFCNRQESGLEVRSLVKTKVPKIEFHAYPARTERHFCRLFALIREYLDALDAGRFNYRPGFSCGFCDYRDGPCRQPWGRLGRCGHGR